MQILISSGFPFRAFATKASSARNGRAIEIKSARPSAKIASATAGVLIRLEAATGIATAALIRSDAETKAARGTACAMVGTRASCQPIPVVKLSAPAASSNVASSTSSSPVSPPSTRSSIDMRNAIARPSATRPRAWRTTSTAKRARFAKLPPQSSSRWLVRGDRNCVSK